MEYSTFGKHIIVDLWGVDFSLLDDMQFLEYHLVTAAGLLWCPCFKRK